MRTTRSPMSSASKVQPTPQYAHVVITERSGVPCWITVFSISVAVGHACTQAPHETHSESRKSSFMPADTCEAKPRSSMVSANVPCTSSQARTQREHTMHFDGSNVKYGFDSSFFCPR